MESQGIIDYLNDRLQLNVQMPLPVQCMNTWRNLAERVNHLRKTVNITLVGKYTKLKDAYAFVIKALQHASIKLR